MTDPYKPAPIGATVTVYDHTGKLETRRRTEDAWVCGDGFRCYTQTCDALYWRTKERDDALTALAEQRAVGDAARATARGWLHDPDRCVAGRYYDGDSCGCGLGEFRRAKHDQRGGGDAGASTASEGASGVRATAPTSPDAAAPSSPDPLVAAMDRIDRASGGAAATSIDRDVFEVLRLLAERCKK